MFEYFGPNFNIGERNTEKVHATLKELGIKLSTKDVGGNEGRTVIVFPADGRKISIRRADGVTSEL